MAIIAEKKEYNNIDTGHNVVNKEYSAVRTNSVVLPKTSSPGELTRTNYLEKLELLAKQAKAITQIGVQAPPKQTLSALLNLTGNMVDGARLATYDASESRSISDDQARRNMQERIVSSVHSIEQISEYASKIPIKCGRSTGERSDETRLLIRSFNSCIDALLKMPDEYVNICAPAVLRIIENGTTAMAKVNAQNPISSFKIQQNEFRNFLTKNTKKLNKILKGKPVGSYWNGREADSVERVDKITRNTSEVMAKCGIFAGASCEAAIDRLSQFTLENNARNTLQMRAQIVQLKHDLKDLKGKTSAINGHNNQSDNHQRDILIAKERALYD